MQSVKVNIILILINLLLLFRKLTPLTHAQHEPHWITYPSSCDPPSFIVDSPDIYFTRICNYFPDHVITILMLPKYEDDCEGRPHPAGSHHHYAGSHPRGS